LGRARIGYGFGREVVVLGAEAEGDQRKRIEFSGGFQFLLGLEASEGIYGILVPGAGGLFGLEVAAGDQGILNLFVPFRGGRHLARTPHGRGANLSGPGAAGDLATGAGF